LDKSSLGYLWDTGYGGSLGWLASGSWLLALGSWLLLLAVAVGGTIDSSFVYFVPGVRFENPEGWWSCVDSRGAGACRRLRWMGTARILVDAFYFSHEDWPQGREFVVGHFLLTALFCFLAVSYLGLFGWRVWGE